MVRFDEGADMGADCDLNRFADTLTYREIGVPGRCRERANNRTHGWPTRAGNWNSVGVTMRQVGTLRSEAQEDSMHRYVKEWSAIEVDLEDAPR